ncbi:nuclear transcription factor Y subunit B-3-like [Pyrus ussuriensis x Pyrus communis]|uniref:Nuclear transcription factor Y subunit B-3-like n=1 Tax=Pyrus ussuriensis x Pyrus communis TaxID=2448454 RepID=A0A5N5IEZ0_9ROSA|nr:nuclear transcription factor Y subunit B-3-like [Pyrus ussuriensis x Pyrus communis]
MADSDNDSGGGGGGTREQQREQDRFLPIANVSRIMKKGLPANGKVSKDAKETCQREKRKTINGEDLLWAMTTLGFEEYVEPLKVYLHKFREMEGEKMTGSTNTSAGTGTGMSAGHGRHADRYHRDHEREQLYVHGHGAARDSINGMYGVMSTQSTTMMTMGHQQNHHRGGHLYGSGGKPSTGHGRPR